MENLTTIPPGVAFEVSFSHDNILAFDRIPKARGIRSTVNSLLFRPTKEA
ncbi:MAG TPA: hypothetical protein VN666_15410 [Nitrospira sp.]|nr:hypothetical protein [Nitrospira sp.]